MYNFDLRPWRAALFVLFFAVTARSAWADPPSRVGRISLAEGALSLRHGEDPQWSPADINYPVIGGDAVWVDQAARGEIEIGGAEARLDQASLLTILRLDDGATQLRLDQGALNLTVRFLAPGGLQIFTAIGQLDIRQPGEYHVDAGRPNGPPTQIVMGVIVGEARFAGLRGEAELHSSQGAMVPPDQSQMSLVALYPTPFDQWAENRALTLQTVQSVRYVSADMTGYQDLDAYGRWEEVPDYGPVWFPTRIDIGWAPYRHGHWAYVNPWGWTWIDEAPWGFAPFHYGRWAQFDGRWAWLPGARGERPCYAPALVAFVGGGGPGTAVGWVPLGPHEVFRPYYPVSDGYLRGINRGHVANVTQISVTNVTVTNYVNRGAVSSVTPAAFSGGQSVRQNMAPLPAGAVNQPASMALISRPPPPTAAALPQQAGARQTAPPAPHPVAAPAAMPPAAGGNAPRAGVALPAPVPPPATGANAPRAGVALPAPIPPPAAAMPAARPVGAPVPPPATVVPPRPPAAQAASASPPQPPRAQPQREEKDKERPK